MVAIYQQDKNSGKTGITHLCIVSAVAAGLPGY
jgi:hypothetical protein